MNVLFVAAEAAPLAKAGGLADVVGSLPKALKKLGVDVRIALPLYRQIDTKQFRITRRAETMVVPFDGIPHTVRLFETSLPGSAVPLYLFDHPHYEGAGDIYYQDVTNAKDQQQLQAERFLFFSRIIPEFLRAIPWKPDLVHCHDWHAAATPFALRRFGDPWMRSLPTIYTIHNLPLQGSVLVSRFAELFALTQKELDLPSAAMNNMTLNLTALGLATASGITTVSPTYAKEILSPEFGEGLDTFLTQHRAILYGILNGIDTERFNPATDPSLPAHFSLHSLEGRAENKKALQGSFGLPEDPTAPLLGFVGRLAAQKGLDLIESVAERVVKAGAQIVILGSGLVALEAIAKQIGARFPRAVSVRIGFDAALAQQIYAGSDLFLMPSRFEPCGLGQMIAMRYGSVPVVRQVGGLMDTVLPFDPATGRGTGFVFNDYDPEQFWEAIALALSIFRLQKDSWKTCQRNGMQQDFSWTRSSREYLRLYDSLISASRSTLASADPTRYNVSRTTEA